MARWRGQLLGILESKGMEIAFPTGRETPEQSARLQGFAEGLGYAMQVINKWEKLGLMPRGRDDA